MNNTLKLNLNIYNLNSIQKAITDYISLCEIEIEEEGDYIICSFYNCKYNINKTIHEFGNYVIDLMNVV